MWTTIRSATKTEVNDKLIHTFSDDYQSVFEYGSGKIKLCPGKVHDYFNMNLYYSVKIQVKITIMDYIREMF